jgi:hypothetical protein
MLDLLIKKELECKLSLIIDLLIHSGIFIRINCEPIAGGVIFEMLEIKMFDGELIIF